MECTLRSDAWPFVSCPRGSLDSLLVSARFARLAGFDPFEDNVAGYEPGNPSENHKEDRHRGVVHREMGDRGVEENRVMGRLWRWRDNLSVIRARRKRIARRVGRVGRVRRVRRRTLVAGDERPLYTFPPSMPSCRVTC